jgi:hypothetical protein
MITWSRVGAVFGFLAIIYVIFHLYQNSAEFGLPLAIIQVALLSGAALLMRHFARRRKDGDQD